MARREGGKGAPGAIRRSVRVRREIKRIGWIHIPQPDGELIQLTVGTVVERQADHVMAHIDDILVTRRVHGL